MSCSRGCIIVEVEDGKWYCIVARDEYDYDFNKFNVYGARYTENGAYNKMKDYEANPGGSRTMSYRDREIPEWIIEAIKKHRG
jgi:hypothetical protein